MDVFVLDAKLEIAPIEKLKGHEEIRPKYLEEFKEQIKSDGIIKMAIAVDKDTCVVLDGHHRMHALKEMGYTKIPVIFVDYHSPKIKVLTWREGETVTKEQIIQTALAGKRMPPKTSRHMIAVNGKLKHISAIETVVNIPLEKLK